MRLLWKEESIGAVVDFLEGTGVGCRASAELARAGRTKIGAKRALGALTERRAGRACPRFVVQRFVRETVRAFFSFVFSFVTLFISPLCCK